MPGGSHFGRKDFDFITNNVHTRKTVAATTSHDCGCVTAYAIFATPLTPVAPGIVLLTVVTTSPKADDATNFFSVDPNAYSPLGRADVSTPSSHPHLNPLLTAVGTFFANLPKPSNAITIDATPM